MKTKWKAEKSAAQERETEWLAEKKAEILQKANFSLFRLMEECSVLPCQVIINSGELSFARDTIEALASSLLTSFCSFHSVKDL